MLIVTLSVARMAPLRPAVAPIVSTELGVRKSDDPVFIWSELILYEAPKLDEAALNRTFWSLNNVPRYSSTCKERMLEVAVV